ncbi:MAG: hypothetical protein RLZ73_667 [Bacteroidota bacterium]
MSTFDPKSILPTLPEEPGVYRYFDESGTIIYIGKAKNLDHHLYREGEEFKKSRQFLFHEYEREGQ